MQAAGNLLVNVSGAEGPLGRMYAGLYTAEPEGELRDEVNQMGNVKAMALAMVARGYSVLPLGENKRPTRKWKHWQQRTPSVDEILTWDEAASLALITGAISGVVVVDCESEVDAAWCLARLLPTGCMVRTRRGMHLYYRHGGERVRNAVQVDGRYDVRGDGGYVVAPGAVARGHEYEWHAGSLGSIRKCPVFDPAWMPAIDNESAEVPSGEAAAVDVVDRAAMYVAACEPAVAGQGGRKRTFRVAACLTRDFGLSVSQAFDVMQPYNERCNPPWTEKQLLREIEGAAARGTRAIGVKAE